MCRVSRRPLCGTSSGLPGKSRDPGGVPVDVALQVLGGVVAGDIAVRVDHALSEMDIRLGLAECGHVEIAQDAAKVLLHPPVAAPSGVAGCKRSHAEQMIKANTVMSFPQSVALCKC